MVEYKVTLKDIFYRFILSLVIFLVIGIIALNLKLDIHSWILAPMLFLMYLPNLVYTLKTGVDIGSGFQEVWSKPVSREENPKKFYGRIIRVLVVIIVITLLFIFIIK
jgi:hypothetical protein